MNDLLTPPPEHDLRRTTHNRQRDELIGIVTHETHEGSPRRPFVPLAAAAAVVAVVAGLAVGVPALRGDDAGEPAVSGAAGQPEIEMLGDADKVRLGKACDKKTLISKHMPSSRQTQAGKSARPGTRPGKEISTPDPYQVIEAFRFKGAQNNDKLLTWVVIHSHLRNWVTCGSDSTGKVLLVTEGGPGEVIYRPVTSDMIGAGNYDKSIARITISVEKSPPVEAVLRHGFYYAPVPFVPLDPRTGSPAASFVVSGYDAAGKLVYTSPASAKERRARSNSCYVGPDGKLTAWMSDNPKPDLKTCRPSYLWNYLP